MKQVAPTNVAVIVLALGLAASQHGSAQTDNYSQIVAKAQTDLSAGNAAQALDESQKAIKGAPGRWEAYVVAGGALQMEHQYDQAIADYSLAVEHAPDAKKGAVRALLLKAENEQVGGPSTSQGGEASAFSGATSSTSDPSYADTVTWITTNMTKAGIPEFNGTKRSLDGSTDQYVEKYSFNAASCQTISVKWEVQHVESWQNTYGSEEKTFNAISLLITFDMGHVDFAISKPNELGVIALDGFGHWQVQRDAYVITGEPISFDNPGYAGDLDPSKIDSKAFEQAGGGGPFYVAPDKPLAWGAAVQFKLPGTTDLPSQMVNAFKHLQELCKLHPEQLQK